MRVRLRPVNVWLEPLLAFVVLGALVRVFFYFREFEHFPQPFFYEPYDVWMDWFNTAYWAYNKGAYDAWGTIYPPLSFVFLRIFTLGKCYADASGYAARECDWVGLATLFSFFFLNIFLLWRTFRKIHRPSAPWRTLALGLGMPTLYGLERGNLIVVTFTFLILGFGPLLKSARLRWIAVGMAVNFKIYLVAGLFPQLLRRRWMWFEGAFLATFAIYVLTYGLLGDGTPLQLYKNVTDVSELYQAATFLDAWYAASYKPLLSLLTGQYQVVAGLGGSRIVDLLIILLTTIQYTVMGIIIAAAVAAWLRPEVVPMHRLTFFGLAFAMTVSEPGGYTMNFLIFFVFLEAWRGFGRIWSICVSYVLLMPLDIILDRVLPTIQESYLAGHTTFFTYYITVGPFVRPLLLQSTMVALAFLTIRDVWRDVQAQGWKTRWRYRGDVPLLPAVAQPVHPQAPQSGDD